MIAFKLSYALFNFNDIHAGMLATQLNFYFATDHLELKLEEKPP